MLKKQRPYLFDAIYRWIIDNESTPHLLVDAKIESVVVPTRLVQDGKIVLNIHPSAIVNFFTEENGISFSARFSGQSEQIFIPYAAMLALFSKENGQGMVFPKEEFTSENISSQAEDKKSVQKTESVENKKPKPKNPGLKLIK